MKGLFIAFDGPGGAGKTTIVSHLATRLDAANLPVTANTEPSRSQLGEFTRNHTRNYTGLALACLVAADRYHHLHTVIRPALIEGRIVLCDRYLASSLVLQGIDGVPEPFVRAINVHADMPDLNVILTGDGWTLRKRLSARGSHGRFEDDPANTRREVERFHNVMDALRAVGVETLAVDTTGRPVESTVSDLIVTIRTLWSQRNQTPYTADA